MQVSKIESGPTLENLPCIWVRDFKFETAQLFCQELFAFSSRPSVEEIFVYVSSYGGAVYSCLMMIDAMQTCNKPVNTIVMGSAASAGAALATCGTGKRFMAPNAYMHIHEASSGMFGDVVALTAAAVEDIKQVNSRLMGLMADRSTLTKKELVKKIKENDKEWNLPAKEALKYEFVDVIGVPKFSQTTTITAEI